MDRKGEMSERVKGSSGAQDYYFSETSNESCSSLSGERKSFDFVTEIIESFLFTFALISMISSFSKKYIDYQSENDSNILSEDCEGFSDLS